MYLLGLRVCLEVHSKQYAAQAFKQNNWTIPLFNIGNVWLNH